MTCSRVGPQERPRKHKGFQDTVPPSDPIQAPTAAGILALITSIEAHPAGSPAAVAFRLALTRKGREADAAGGAEAIDTLLREVAMSDPARADARTALVREAWADLMPGPGGRARP